MRDPEDALMEARETMPHACPECGEMWPYEEDECECGAYKARACNLCERRIPETLGPALCTRCEATCRAHARLDRATAEWIADGRPD